MESCRNFEIEISYNGDYLGLMDTDLNIRQFGDGGTEMSERIYDYHEMVKNFLESVDEDDRDHYSFRINCFD